MLPTALGRLTAARPKVADSLILSTAAFSAKIIGRQAPSGIQAHSTGSLQTMSSTKRYQPTPQQIALAKERKAKRAKISSSQADEAKGKILARKWVQLPVVEHQQDGTRRVKVMTWNLLAQCLVRRELFPTSDCLKSSQREDMIYNEILSHGADIMSLQEVDRLEKLLPVLEGADYVPSFAAGPNKKHGCLIAYNRKRFTKVDEKIIHFDNEEIRSDGDERARLGCSIRSTNIAFMLALQTNGAEGKGVIVATTHLFWHQKYTYERARQAGILVREVLKFRKDSGYDDWPCIINGDFNFAPNDPTYSLLVGDPLLPAQVDALATSRVVHVTVDPDVPPTATAPAEEDGDVLANHPDRIITNARPAIPSDGLLTIDELVDLYTTPVRSAYEEGLTKHRASNSDVVTFGNHVPFQSPRRGANEPEWTSYTHYWKTVLDYIFILDGSNSRTTVAGFAQPHRTEDLEPGLPRKGVCGSDHISLNAEIIM